MAIIITSNYYNYRIIVVVIVIIGVVVLVLVLVIVLVIVVIVVVVVIIIIIIIILISRFTPLYLFSSAFLNPLLSLLRAFSDSSCRRLSRSWKTAAGTITRP